MKVNLQSRMVCDCGYIFMEDVRYKETLSPITKHVKSEFTPKSCPKCNGAIESITIYLGDMPFGLIKNYVDRVEKAKKEMK